LRAVSEEKLLNVRAWQRSVGLNGKSTRNIMKEEIGENKHLWISAQCQRGSMVK